MFNTILYNSVTEKYIYKQTIFKAKKSKKNIFSKLPFSIFNQNYFFTGL